uniref:Zf-C2H2_2 domain-containing protein n=1 Tax=Ascaris lumbricoides TaxID=6252 RepID=A0A0M3ITF1_ASCLU
MKALLNNTSAHPVNVSGSIESANKRSISDISYEALIFEGKLESLHQITIWMPDLQCPACTFQDVDEDKLIAHMIECRALRKDVTEELLEQDKNDYRLFEMIPRDIYDRFSTLADRRIAFCGRTIDQNCYIGAPIDSRVGQAILAGMQPRLHLHKDNKKQTGRNINYSNTIKIKAKMVKNNKIMNIYLYKEPMKRRNAATRFASCAKMAKKICRPFVIDLTCIERSNDPEALRLYAGALGYEVDPFDIEVDDIADLAKKVCQST